MTSARRAIVAVSALLPVATACGTRTAGDTPGWSVDFPEAPAANRFADLATSDKHQQFLEQTGFAKP